MFTIFKINTVESFYNEELGNIKCIRYNEFRFNEITIVLHG
jgi:hypothetical protein